MPYTITFWNKAYLPRTGKGTSRVETAAEAWKLVQDLTASDEEVEIQDSSGFVIGWQELKMEAEREAD